jgi:subfamily B ATP-binding cassette protein MsbA
VIFEGIGIGLFFPLIGYIQEGESFLDDGKFKYLLGGMKLLGIGPGVLSFILIIFSVIVCRFAVVHFTHVMSAWTYNPIMKQIRDDGFRKIVSSPMEYFHSISSGKMVSILINEVELVGQSINFVNLIIVNTAFMLVYTFFIVFISWKLSMVIILIALLRYKVLAVFVKQLRRFGKRNTKIKASFNAYLISVYQGIDVIKSYATEKRELKRFKGMTTDFLNNVNRIVYNQAGSSFTEGVLSSGLICFIIYLAVSVFNVAGASILVFLFIVSRIVPCMTAINDARIRVAEYTSGIVYLKMIFDDNSLPSQQWGNLVKSRFESMIVFDGISFSYHDKGDFVLKDINLTIGKNERVAIVGESGAGKTTFIRLLLRLYDSTIGNIYIDGANITEIRRDSWKHLVSVVSQDTFIFNDTVENNIKYSVEQCTDDEFWAVVRRARAEEFINNLPEKEKTVLGERGVRLSGGQRQRVAIARAFLRDSPILILDEATSALDSVTESLIKKALKDLSMNRTMIIVAHRLSTIKDADRIVVLDKGEIVEIGTHEELLRNENLYKKYHNLQLH